MFEGDPTATTPMTPLIPPPPPVRPSSGIPAGRLVALGLLAFALAAFSGRIDLNSLVSTARNYVDRAAPGVQTSTSTSDTAAVAAVKDVVQRANEAQVQAFARNDPTLMRATATSAYYQELVQTNQNLQSSGAQSIALTKHAEEAWKFCKHITSREAIEAEINKELVTLPGRKSAMPNWLDIANAGGKPPASAKAIADEVNNTPDPIPALPYYQEFSRTFDNAISGIMTGEKKAAAGEGI